MREVLLDMIQFFSYLVNGIGLGSVYAIIALGYSMVYGIAKMLNFAHGDVIMIGAYVSFCASYYWGLPPVVSVLCAVGVCTALGITIERFAYKPLRQASSLAVLITAIGMSYLLQNSAQLIWGANPKNFPSLIGLPSLSLFGGQMIVTGTTMVTMVMPVTIICPPKRDRDGRPIREGTFLGFAPQMSCAEFCSR